MPVPMSQCAFHIGLRIGLGPKSPLASLWQLLCAKSSSIETLPFRTGPEQYTHASNVLIFGS